MLLQDPDSLARLKKELAERLSADRVLLDELRAEVRPLRSATRRIQPRSTTSIALVGTDGGNNRIQFDPFLIQLIRVVDSSNNEYCLEAITPTTDILKLSAAQFGANGHARTALGELMAFLGAADLPSLSHMIRRQEDGRPTSTSWVLTYRGLVEWAVLFNIIRSKDFGTDTVIVCDGLLRSKLFAGDLFPQLMEGIRGAIEEQYRRNRRRVYLVGVAKHNAVLTRYRLAMSLEGVLQTSYPAYVEIPTGLEEKAYVWSEWARGEDLPGREINRYVGGKMFFVKFGSGPRDPIWPIDIFTPQKDQAQMVLGYLLADAAEGFPVPHYPRCLQRAHDNAALVDFDMDVLRDQVFAGLHEVLGGESGKLDAFRLQDPDPARARYG
jgi:hypothetical protein